MSAVPGKVTGGRTRFRRGLTDRQLALALILPTAILLGVFELYPFVVAVRDSFFYLDLVGSAPDKFVGLANYTSVLGDPETHAAFIRTFEFIAGSVASQTIVGMITALLLDQGLRGQLLWRGLNLFPYMVPAIVATMLFRFSFNELYGPINYLLVASHLTKSSVPFLTDTHTIMFTVILISSWRHVPFMTIVFLARLQTVPGDLTEAAIVDGAGPLRVFRFIILPWLLPVILVAMLLRTIWAGVEFDFPYLTAFGGPLHASTVVPIQIYTLYTEQNQIGKSAALAVCVGLVLLLASSVYLRFYKKLEQAAG
jgi:multiple sugar transport system permease protein